MADKKPKGKKKSQRRTLHKEPRTEQVRSNLSKQYKSSRKEKASHPPQFQVKTRSSGPAERGSEGHSWPALNRSLQLDLTREWDPSLSVPLDSSCPILLDTDVSAVEESTLQSSSPQCSPRSGLSTSSLNEFQESQSTVASASAASPASIDQGPDKTDRQHGSRLSRGGMILRPPAGGTLSFKIKLTPRETGRLRLYRLPLPLFWNGSHSDTSGGNLFPLARGKYELP